MSHWEEENAKIEELRKIRQGKKYYRYSTHPTNECFSKDHFKTKKEAEDAGRIEATRLRVNKFAIVETQYITTYTILDIELTVKIMRYRLSRLTNKDIANSWHDSIKEDDLKSLKTNIEGWFKHNQLEPEHEYTVILEEHTI